MSDSVELTAVRRWYATRDPELLAPDVQYDIAPGFPLGGRYSGRESVLKDFYGKLKPRYAAWASEPHAFYQCGDRVVVLGQYRVKLTADSAEATSRFVHIWRVKDGKLAEIAQCADSRSLPI